MGLQIIPRKEWDPDPNQRVKTEWKPGPLIVHHTASPALSVNAGKKAATAEAVAIDNYHESKGWSGGFGYSYGVIGKYVFEGRGEAVGAHTFGYNSDYPAVVVDGNFQAGDRLMPIQRELLVELARYLGRTSLAGHRDFNLTDCPGDALYAELDGLTDALDDEPDQDGEHYYFETLAWTDGGSGPKLLGGWGTPAVRDSQLHLLRTWRTATPAKFDSKASPYGIILWPPGGYGMASPRWRYTDPEVRNARQAEYEQKTGLKTRRFRGLKNSIYARRP